MSTMCNKFFKESSLELHCTPKTYWAILKVQTWFLKVHVAPTPSQHFSSSESEPEEWNRRPGGSIPLVNKHLDVVINHFLWSYDTLLQPRLPFRSDPFLFLSREYTSWEWLSRNFGVVHSALPKLFPAFSLYIATHLVRATVLSLHLRSAHPSWSLLRSESHGWRFRSRWWPWVPAARPGSLWTKSSILWVKLIVHIGEVLTLQ